MKHCELCRIDQPNSNRFCGQCGSLLEDANGDAPAAVPLRANAQGERRQMTILFYDMVDSTALAAAIDPEDFSELVNRFHDAVESTARNFGGFVGSRVGDGAVVYFGYPDAQEDAAERAVLTGLRSVECVRDIILPTGEAAAIRVGIATGEGIINRLGEGDSGNEVIGNVANLAARLQSYAARGTVIISDGTRRVLSGRFDLEDVGQLEIKGFATPVQAWQVSASDNDDQFVSSLDRVEAPLVGRDESVGRLRDCFAQCRAGDSRVLLVIADPGVGKSRLVRAILNDYQIEASNYVAMSCSAHSKNTPLHPFMRHLRHCSRPARGESVTAPSGLASGIESGHADALLLQTLAHSGPELIEEFKSLSAAQRMDRVVAALVGQLERLSRDDTLLVVLEDAHWADPSSLTVLDRAINEGKFDRAMIVITARPEFQPDWARSGTVETIYLYPLDQLGAESLLLSVPGADRLPPSVRKAILRRANGVPLFLLELTQSSIELAAEGGEEALLESELPMSLQDSLLARLGRLGPAKRIAQVAAVIGDRFTSDNLAELTGRNPQEVGESLARLESGGLIHHDYSRGEQQYVFNHVLIREAAYSTILKADRRALNRQLFTLLESGPRSIAERAPGRLAHYAAEADMGLEAARYWLKAGLDAIAKSAMAEARARLQHGLASVTKLPENAERSAVELPLQLAFGKALIATDGYATPATGAAFERARALCEITGKRREQLAALHGLWIHDLLCNRLDSASTRADALMKAAEAEGDPVWVVVACRANGVLNYARGRFQHAIVVLERGIALSDPNLRVEYAKVVVDDPSVVMLVYKSWVLTYLGRDEEALAVADEALAEARRLQQPLTIVHALNGWILVRVFQHKFADLDDAIDELAHMTSEHEIKFYAAVGDILRARIQIGLGDLNSGCRLMTQAIDEYSATGSELYMPTYKMWLAEGLMKLGLCDRAGEVLQEAEVLVERTGGASDAAAIALARGELQQRLGKVADAEKTIRHAIRTAEMQGAALHLKRCKAALQALQKNKSILAAIS